MSRITITTLQGIKDLLGDSHLESANAFDKILKPLGIDPCGRKYVPWRLISIISPGDGIAWNVPRMVALGCNGLLTLQFDDITESQAQTQPAQEKRLKLFSKLQGEKVIQFLDNLKEEEKLVVHCEGGISRSAAIAYYAAMYLGLDSNKEFNSNLYFPNPYVLDVLHSLVNMRQQ